MAVADHDYRPERSFATLFKELRDELVLLFRQEVQLAKTEATEQATYVGKQGVFIGAGAIAALIGVYFLLVAVSIAGALGFEALGLTFTVGLIVSTAIVGGIILIIGMGMLFKGKNSIGDTDVLPRTRASIKETKDWTTERFKH